MSDDTSGRVTAAKSQDGSDLSQHSHSVQFYGDDRAAQEAAARLAAIVASSEDAIVSKDLNGIVTSWNASAERIFGYKAEEMIGKPILTIIPPELHPDEEMILSKIRRGERIEHFETVRVAKDGRRIDVSLTISPIKDAEGRVAGAAKIARDITQRKLAEQALRESEERFRSMAETAADAIFRIDEESTVLFANPATQKIFGYSAEELAGKSLTVLMPEYLREVHRAGLQRYLETGKRHMSWERAEVTGLHKDGQELAIELSLSEFRSNGRRVFTGFARDVSERKRTEEALRRAEKMAATGQLAATIAHEINNPMQALTNLLALVASRTALDEGTRHLVALAEGELSRMSHITRQMLSFYRESAAPVPLRIIEVLEDVLELFVTRLRSNEIRVERRYEFAGEIHGYPVELRQLFANLLSNAIEALGHKGRIHVHISPSRDMANPERRGIRILIADNGPGIKPELRQRIFEPFFTTKAEKGTGLGLWVVKEIVAKHDGSIRMRSSTVPGRSGTVFSVFLPMEIEWEALAEKPPGDEERVA